MAIRGWTVMLVPHSDGSTRSVSVSVTAARLLIGALAILAATALAAALGVTSRALDIQRAERLERENRVLQNALQRLDGRVANLSDTLAAISLRDQQVRLVAGLEPLDPDVRRAGIGGPEGSWPVRDRLAEEGGATSREALRVTSSLDALIRRANLVAASYRQAAETLARHVERLSATPSIMPTNGFLTSRFSYIRYHPILHESRPHEGIDVTAPYGAPIIAPARGRVVKVGWETGYGLMVVLDHGYGLETRYAHMSRTGVQVGQTVRRGDRLGFVGNSGLSTGPHLHYEVLVGGRATDPMRFVMPDAIAD
jgi:murein DD-endopeptidase MepM/ murein hydrolase activator NlpD